jgi:very-short-patch-repair endonuclease
VVARQQLLELGISEAAIDYRLQVGRLRRLFPGAYAAGHEALPLAARALAGIISARPAAAASHWTAAAIHGLIDRPRALIHVTCPNVRRPRRGLSVHRAILPSDEIAHLAGVPTTIVARTLLDLSAASDHRTLRTLIKRAEFKGLVTAGDITAILARYPRRRGRGTLARIAAGYGLTETRRTASPLEDDFLDFCAARHLPLPETNVPLRAGSRAYVADCLWREARLVVELDGRAAHARELAFEDDRRRDRALIAAGWRTARVTSAALRFEGDDLETELRALLG